MILATVAVLSAFVTANAVEATLHSCPPPDTEFETNLVAEAWDDFDRIMGIRLEFNASPSNNVQIAFGSDENHDGVLSVEESAMSDEEALDVLRRVYLAEISIDRPPIPSHMTATNMPFEVAYSNLLRKTGWTARRCIDETCIMISNMCTRTETFADGPQGYIYAGAVNAMGRHGDGLAIPYINYAFDNVVTENAFDEAFALARLKGLGHAAFELYDSKRSSRRVEDLALAVRHFTINRNVNESVTNRTVRFFLNIADGGQWETSLPDSVLCKMFPGYSTSSNRYEHIVSRIPTATSSNMSNELFSVKSELLALPPGTMQMLPTNQFYNVED